MKMIFALFLACICVKAAHPTGLNLTSNGAGRFNVSLHTKQSPTGVLYEECIRML